MIACYDLACCPPTYDVCTFLGHAEYHRKQFYGSEGIDIHILPGPNNGFRRDGLWPKSTGHRRTLLNKIVVPMCKLLPSVYRITVDKTRPNSLSGSFGHHKRHISLGKYLELMRNDIRPFRCRSKIAKKKNLVTITLRECEHWPERNSNIPEWLKAAEEIEKLGFDVVFVRDTRLFNTELEDFSIDSDAALDLEKRAELYASATINLGINNGPMWMALMMDIPVLMIKVTCDQLRGCYDTEYYKRNGLSKGHQLPLSPAYQKLVWEEDRCEFIVEGFKGVLECLHG